jgi:hypothetical protein
METENEPPNKSEAEENSTNANNVHTKTKYAASYKSNCKKGADEQQDRQIFGHGFIAFYIKSFQSSYPIHWRTTKQQIGRRCYRRCWMAFIHIICLDVPMDVASLQRPSQHRSLKWSPMEMQRFRFDKREFKEVGTVLFFWRLNKIFA